MDDNRLISENADGITVTYTYDDLGRLTQKQTKNGDTVIKTDSYAFTASTVGTNGTSSQVASYNGLSYTYDDNANILSVSDGTNTTTYQYDSANQLVRENNQAQNFTKVWNYDNAGNILSRSEYAYTTGDLSTATETVTYQYTSSKWGDMLRVYDGQNLTYDASGNLTSDGKYTYTWAHGRQLARITAANGAQMLMTYGADGLRTGRVKTNSSGATAGTYTYVYDGGKLSQMTYGNYVVDITYDAAGTPLTMTVNGQTTYHYVTNLQGDVIALTDDTGAEVITYSYDAWGKVVSRTGTYATLNPLLYRGYVYDWETHHYYLQSRYYNPEWGRFINADDIAYLGADGVFASFNLFAYCVNAPVRRKDTPGTTSVDVFDDGDSNLLDEEKTFEGGGQGGSNSSGNTGGSSGGPKAGSGSYGNIRAGTTTSHSGNASDPVNDYLESLGQDPSKVIECFNEKPQLQVLTEDTTVYRVWGGTTQEYGHWVSPYDYGNAAGAALSLPPGNTMTYTSSFVILAGSTVLTGTAAPYFGQPGGGIQWWIYRIECQSQM